MRKYFAYAMAVAVLASTVSLSGAASAADSLIKPVDPGLKPTVAEDCYHEKSYGGRNSMRGFFGGDNHRNSNRNRNRHNDND